MYCIINYKTESKLFENSVKTISEKAKNRYATDDATKYVSRTESS